MQCPDVVVANLDTNSFSSKQTVHVNEVLFIGDACRTKHVCDFRHKTVFSFEYFLKTQFTATIEGLYAKGVDIRMHNYCFLG